MKIRIKKLHPDAILPSYAHGPDEDAAMDLRALERIGLDARGRAGRAHRHRRSSCRAGMKHRCGHAAAWP